jgi:hypothetical protein
MARRSFLLTDAAFVPTHRTARPLPDGLLA